MNMSIIPGYIDSAHSFAAIAAIETPFLEYAEHGNLCAIAEHQARSDIDTKGFS